MKSFIAQLRWLLSPQDKRKFIFIAFLMALAAMLELLGLGVLLGAATLFLSPESSAGEEVASLLNKIIPWCSPDEQIIWVFCSIGLLLVVKNIFAYGIINIQAKFIFGKRNDIARRLYACYLYADYEHITRLTADYCFSSFARLQDVCNGVLLPAMQVLADIMVILLLTVAVAILFPTVSILSIVFMLAAAITVSILTKHANQRNGRKNMAANLEESRCRQTGIAGMKTIKSFAREEFFIERFFRSHTNYTRYSCKLYSLGQLPRLSLESSSIVLACGVFAIMMILDVEKSQILLVFAVLTAAVSRILPALSRCHYNMTLIRQNYPLLESIYLDLHDLPAESAPVAPAANADEKIVFKDVDFSYKEGKQIFDHLNLTVEPKTSLAIAGKSGRGKSTLIDLLLGLLKPDHGTICAGTIPIANDVSAWRRQLGIVPQNIFIFDGTVAENVAFGETNIDNNKVKSVLKLAGLSNFAPDLPLTSQGNISGGQRQRIGIARALYHNAKVLILDEATSALDAETENAFCEVLQELKGKITLIVISHRESTLDICDQKIVL